MESSKRARIDDGAAATTQHGSLGTSAQVWAGAILADLVCARDSKENCYVEFNSNNDCIDEAANKIFLMALQIKCASSTEKAQICAENKASIDDQLHKIVNHQPLISPKQQSSNPVGQTPEPLEDASMGVNSSQCLPFKVQAAEARAAVTKMVNSVELGTKKLILEVEEKHSITLPTYTRFKGSETAVSTQRLVAFTRNYFLPPNKSHFAHVASQSAAAEESKCCVHDSRRAPIEIDGADPDGIELFAQFIESQPPEAASLTQIHGMFDLIGRLQATQLLEPFAQYASAVVKHASHWQVVRLIAQALEVAPAAIAVRIVGSFINDELRSKPFQYTRGHTGPAAAPLGSGATDTSTPSRILCNVSMNAALGKDQRGGDDTVKEAHIKEEPVNEEAIRAVSLAERNETEPGLPSDAPLDALVAYSASIFGTREPSTQRTYALLTCMRGALVPSWLLIAFLSAACMSSPVWSRANIDLMLWVVDKVVAQGLVASALLERALVRLSRGPLTSARVHILTTLLLHVSGARPPALRRQAAGRQASKDSK